ncbi:nuclear transport factor 2 family protein [Myxococcus qinghaiensis]|uniref:nuclear transport factor 2 family protein n=1 Tax=Myxococcus qinghaiensis TaxID=2906758 RepID=UPI0020A72F81|nr:nuclear transport factor 2 family protein [Myxococcus qinghaiensis]MCP3163408.1 nuclear transport factor 2 family protein [Myxococcus qinghaiensis]
MMTEEVLLAAEESLRQAMLQGDVTALDALISDDLVFVNHTGQVFDKEADLAAHRSRALRLTRMDMSAPIIRYLSAGAVFIVSASVKGTHEGTVFEARLRYSRVWQWVDERPQVITGQCTVILGGEPS